MATRRTKVGEGIHSVRQPIIAGPAVIEGLELAVGVVERPRPFTPDESGRFSFKQLICGRRELWRLQAFTSRIERTTDRLGTRLQGLLRDDWQGMCIAFLRRQQEKAVRRYRAGVGTPQGLQRKDGNFMKRKASVSHDEAIIR